MSLKGVDEQSFSKIFGTDTVLEIVIPEGDSRVIVLTTMKGSTKHQKLLIVKMSSYSLEVKEISL